MNFNTSPTPPARVASPCTSVCRIDDDSGLCAGCWRSIREIAGWSAMDDARRLQVLAAVAARREGREMARE
ncbi:MAG: DUF1289 domain-containing protein [Rhodocyclales bacterium]|nr:DUF1289 domain-containing protein [Rhodocyclales bacterium]